MVGRFWRIDGSGINFRAVGTDYITDYSHFVGIIPNKLGDKK